MPWINGQSGSTRISNGAGLVVVNADGSVSVTPATGTGVLLGVAPPATATRALFQIGSGPVDGTSAGHYTGSASGGGYGANFASGYAGDLMNLQVAGVRKIKGQADGSMFLDASAGTTTSPTTIGFDGFVAGAACRVQFGDTNSAFQNATGDNLQIYSYHALELVGGRQLVGGPAFRTVDTVGVLITNTGPAKPALSVAGAALQTGDLIQATDSATHTQFAVANIGSGAAPVWALRVRATANAESMAQAHVAGANTGRAIQIIDDAGVSLGWLNLTA